MKNVIGMVLGGGKGTRLFPLTYVRSKPAVPLGGKYRLIDIPISNCINSGVERIYVLTQYNSASLNRHINLTYRFGMFSQGFVDILAAEQTHDSVRWYQGTADAVRQSLRHVLDKSVKFVLILSGDQLYRMDFAALYWEHIRHSADVTVCALPVEVEKAAGFGILKMERDGRITDFHEKPKEDKLLERLKADVKVWQKAGVSARLPLLASMGIYLFGAEALVELLKDETKLDFGGQVIPGALHSHKVYGHVFDGYWEDIGTIGAFYKANLDLTRSNPQFNFYDARAPIYTHPRFLPASRIQKSHIERSIISEGCFVRNARIKGSVIGIRSVIGDGAQITDSLVLGTDYYESDSAQAVPIGIGDGAVVKKAIIDKNARVGRNVRIVNTAERVDFDGDCYYIRDGVVIIPKNAIVPDGTVI